MNPIIKVRNLSRQFEYYRKNPGIKSSIRNLFKREKIIKYAVENVSFDISEGEFVGFIGPNGAGKTTTLKMLSGILTPTSGKASVLGHIPWKRESIYKKQFSLVMGQKNQLWWDLPALESFILNQKIYDIEKNDFQKKLNELIDLLGVENIIHKQVRKLSLGERMKCELIAALLHQPKILFLDEPTIGLDIVAQKNVRDFLKKYNRENKTTIILTSHYMDDIAELCERIIVINLGKVTYDGPTENLVQKYANHKIITVFFNEAVDKEKLEKFGEIFKFDPFKVSLKVSRLEIKKTASDILSSDLPVHDIEIGEEDIESVIRNIFTPAK